MKPIIKHILAGFSGSLVSIALFIGALWCIDIILEHKEEKANLPLNEKVLAYMDKHDIPYEEVDTFTYGFTLNDIDYVYFYDDEDSKYLHIVSIWPIDSKDHLALIKIANELEWEKKFIKIVIKNDKIVFSIEQLIDTQTDIDAILPRCLKVLHSAALEFSSRMEAHH